jgi:hypothetical protein
MAVIFPPVRSTSGSSPSGVTVWVIGPGDPVSTLAQPKDLVVETLTIVP